MNILLRLSETQGAERVNNPLHANITFEMLQCYQCYQLKSSENLCFSCVFRVYSDGALVVNELRFSVPELKKNCK